ncbi:hypothetical protein Daus18300_001404 [Diaporthe australafricana]|uniref:Condensation domain-containing protein n=1 Tax=Diaporthe australafricana TaxID=127596 RepID=A0ABR3XVK9_9PEZI
MMQDDGLSIEIEWNKYMLHQELIHDWTCRLEHIFDRPFELEGSEFLGQNYHITKFIGFDAGNGYDDIESTCQRLGIELSDVEAVYPCSPIQDSLMLSQLRQPNGVYDQCFLFKILPSDDRVSGPDSTRLAEAWTSVVAKHPILRTEFAQDDSGSFLQLVLRSIDPDIECLPLKDEDALPEVWETGSRTAGILPLSGKVLHGLKIYTTQAS